MAMEVHVPADYATIQAGIDAVEDGGTVYVAGQTFNYSTKINVTKSVAIVGAGKENTFVYREAMTAYDYVFDVSAASNVTIKDMTIGALSPNYKNGYYIGSAPGGYSPTNFLTIDGVAFGTGRSAIMSSGNNLVVQNCVFSGERYRASIRPTGAGFLIKNNVFTDLHSANGPIMRENGTAPLTGEIAGNTFANGPLAADHQSSVFTVEFYGNTGAGNLSVHDNIFDGVTNDHGVVFNGRAIYFEVTLYTFDPTKIFIENNSFTGYHPQVLTVQGTPTISGNQFTDNKVRQINFYGLAAPDVEPALNTALATNVFDRAVIVQSGASGYFMPYIYGSIQTGIDAAAAGDTVTVSPGTYYEGILITKALTVRSAEGAFVTVIDGHSATENYYVVQIEADNVTMDGFTITNPLYEATADASGVVISAEGRRSNIRVVNNIIHDIGLPSRAPVSFGTFGINCGPVDNLIVEDNTIYNIANGGTDVRAIGIFAWGNSEAELAENIVIRNNAVLGMATPGYKADGINAAGFTANVTLEGNRVSDVKRGIVTSDSMMGPATITNNQVTEASSYGVLLESAYEQMFERNTITECNIGIEIPFAEISPAINYNDIYHNNLYGLESAAIIQIDARNNWWGGSEGPNQPGTDRIYGNLNYTPWLTRSIHADVNVPGDYPDIQAGINAVAAGGTVHVAPGMYTGAVYIHKPLILQATGGPAATVIDGNSATDNYFVVSIEASDVTVDGFTITNPRYDGTVVAAGVAAGFTGTHSNIRVSNNIIHDVGQLTRPSTNLGTFGVICGPTDGLAVRGNTIYNIGNGDPAQGAAAIFVWGDNPEHRAGDTASNIVIDNNVIYDVIHPGTMADGINIGDDTEQVTVTANTITRVKRGIVTNAAMAGAVTIAHNRITGASDYGMLLRSSLAQTVLFNSITGSAIGIEADVTSGPATINHNSIFGNAVYGLNNLSAARIDATNNWWGSIRGPNRPGSDRVNGNVSFAPWVGEKRLNLNRLILCYLIVRPPI